MSAGGLLLGLHVVCFRSIPSLFYSHEPVGPGTHFTLLSNIDPQPGSPCRISWLAPASWSMDLAAGSSLQLQQKPPALAQPLPECPPHHLPQLAVRMMPQMPPLPARCRNKTRPPPRPRSLCSLEQEPPHYAGLALLACSSPALLLTPFLRLCTQPGKV